MPSPLKLAAAWRIVRDVDLEGIRRAAQAPFQLWIVSEDPHDAEAVRAAIGAADPPHPWVKALDLAALAAPLSDAPLAALLVTRSLELSAAMGAALTALRARSIPVMTIVAGETGPSASAPRRGENARVAVTGLDPSAVAPLATTLLSLFGDDRRLALARQLPRLRMPLFQQLTQETAHANASFAFTTGVAETVPVLAVPMAIGDIFVLTKNQVLLGYRIVLAAGHDGEPRRLIGEVLGVLGGGLLFRQIAREMIGLVPIAGLPLKIAVAYSGTWAIGKALSLWVLEGRAVTSDAVRGMMTEGLERGRSVATRLLAGRRGHES